MSALPFTGESSVQASTASDSIFDVRAFIDGRGMSGYQWMILALCFLIVMTDGMDVAIMGFLAPVIVPEWGVSRGTFGLVMSAAPVGLAVGALLAGPLADRLGRRSVLLVSVLLFGGFSLVSSLASTVGALAGLRFLTGLGLGAAMPCTTTLLSEYVPARSRGFLITCMFTGFNLGSALIGFAAAALLPHQGWRSVLVLGGALPLALLPLHWLLLPESARFLVNRGRDGAQVARTLRRVCGESPPADTAFTLNEAPVPPRTSVAVLVSPHYLRRTLALWLAYFMGLVVIYLLSSWMPSLVKDAGLPVERAARLTAMFQLGGTLGAVAVGLLMDRLAPNRVIACAYLGGAVAVLALAGGGALSAWLGAVVALAGFCMSGAQTGLNAYAPGRYPTQVRATGVSWMLGIGRLGGILGSLVGGVLLGLGWGFGTVLASLALPALIAAGAIYLSQRGHATVDEAL